MHLCRIWFLDYKNEPLRDKTNKMACAPSEDSDQPISKLFVTHFTTNLLLTIYFKELVYLSQNKCNKNLLSELKNHTVNYDD